MQVYRAIKRDPDDRPWVNHSVWRGLGVREGHDIHADDDGYVHPGTEGPTVFDTPTRLLAFMRKKVSTWVLETDDLPTYLTCRQDDDDEHHCFLEPSYSMELEDFKTAIAETRDLWQEIERVP
jgi:hypothetical protein